MHTLLDARIQASGHVFPDRSHHWWILPSSCHHFISHAPACQQPQHSVRGNVHDCRFCCRASCFVPLSSARTSAPFSVVTPTFDRLTSHDWSCLFSVPPCLLCLQSQVSLFQDTFPSNWPLCFKPRCLAVSNGILYPSSYVSPRCFAHRHWINT
jgi:hypothetical protein